VHFEQVLALLRGRGVAFVPQKPAPYAGMLRAATRSQDPGRLVDALLFSALIEARSCERFELLAAAVPDAGPARLLRGLHAAEVAPPARLRRARGIVRGAGRAARAPRTTRAREAEILAQTPLSARMHAGALA
jgi:tRNA-(ms[2]io[6]A)-hydroxylase